jgi:hypothetical protein
VNLYILMPWGMVEVKGVGKPTFVAGNPIAHVHKENSTDYAAYVDTSKFPIVFAEEPPTISKLAGDGD